MAYRSRKSNRRSKSRSYRSFARPSRSRVGARNARTRGRGRVSSTVRIEIVQPQANAASRPPLGQMVDNSKPRKAQF